MGKMYIGVMAVGGHKLWGDGWKAGCGIRWFRGMGGRWKIDGRRREVAGRACPAPTGWRKGERVLAGRYAGVGWFRAIFVGGGILDVPRRGQDPSLRCGRLEGGYGKVRGPGMPGPYGVVEGCAGADREGAVGEVTGHCCVYCRIRSKISLRILCKSRILLL